MKLINHHNKQTLCLEFSELVKSGVSEIYLKKAKSVGASCWDFLKDPEDGRKVLIVYETLKPKYQQQFKNHKCKHSCEACKSEDYENCTWNPYKHLAASTIEPHLISKEADLNTLQAYTYNGATHLDKAYKSRCIEACKYLYLLECADTTMIKNVLGFQSKAAFMDAIVYVIKDKDVKLPATEDRLYKKLKEYKEKGALSVIDAKLGNQNTRKIGTGEFAEQQIKCIEALQRRHNNFNVHQITQMYNTIAKAASWKEVTPGAIFNNLKGEMNAVTIAGKYGTKKFDQKILAHNKRKKPTAPLYFLSVDGWNAELAYKRREVVKRKDKNGKPVKTEITTYDNRLTIVVILDMFNKYPLGYAIGEHENVELIKQAMRNAFHHVRELTGTGDYLKPWQVQSDRYGLKQMTAFYEACTKIFTPAAVGNAKAKPVEPYFKRLNTQYCQYLNNWTGFGWQADADNQVNREYLDKIKNDFPDKHGCIQQLVDIVEAERSVKKEAFVNALNSLSADNKLSISRTDYLDAIGAYDGYSNSINGYGLTPTIFGNIMEFDTMNDPSFRLKYNHIKWKVYYDENDLSNVLAVSKCDKYKFLLHQKETPAMAIKDKTDDDERMLKEVKTLNAHIKQHVTDSVARTHEVLSDFMPGIQHQVDKRVMLQLTDKNGQQKDNIQRHQRKLIDGPIENAVLVEAPAGKAKKVIKRELTEEEIIAMI